jgi:hypothetical protein
MWHNDEHALVPDGSSRVALCVTFISQAFNVPEGGYACCLNAALP